MRKVAVAASVAALLLCGTVSRAEVGDIDTGLSVSLAGKYMWRGADLGPVGLISDGYARYQLLDNVTINGYVWNYTRLAGGRGTQETDLDGSISWTPSWFGGKLTLTGGYIYYDNNNTASSPAFGGVDTMEVYGGLDYDHWLRPSVYAYYDLDQNVGTYVVGSIGHSWDLTELGIDGWVLDADGWVGLDFGRGIDTFNDAGVRFAFSTQLEEGLTFGPAVDLWFPSNQVNVSSFRPNASLGFSYNKTY